MNNFTPITLFFNFFLYIYHHKSIKSVLLVYFHLIYHPIYSILLFLVFKSIFIR